MRLQTIITDLDLRQHQIAKWLRVTQPSVTRMLAKCRETGPASALLDHLEAQIAAHGAVVVRSMVLAGRMLPEQADFAAAAPQPPSVEAHRAGSGAVSMRQHQSGFSAMGEF